MVRTSIDVSSDRPEFQIQGPSVLIPMILETSLIFLNLNFPFCKIKITTWIERGGNGACTLLHEEEL